MKEYKSVWPKLNKQETLESYIEQVRLPAINCNRCTAIVTNTVCLTCDEWDEFRQHLLTDRPWLAGKGGSRGMGERYVVLVVRPGETADESLGIFVDPQGYDYASYVGFYLSNENMITNVPDLPTLEEAMATTLCGVSMKDRILNEVVA